MTGQRRPYTVLAVCTGNICRSPALQLRLQELLGPTVAVAGAGLHARVGEPVDPAMAALLGPASADLRARQVTPPVIAAADLVLAMTARQRGALVGRVPAAVRRVFTVREFAELAELALVAGQAGADPAAPVHERLAALVCAAPRFRGRRRDGDDVEDPYGAGAGAAARSLAAIDDAVDRIAAALGLLRRGSAEVGAPTPRR